jgi:hypothetical protein
VSENKVPTKILGPKKDKADVQLKIPYNKELYELHRSTMIVLLW